MLAANTMRELPNEYKFKHEKKNRRAFERQSPAVRHGINRDARNQRRQTENKGGIAQQKRAAGSVRDILPARDENRDSNRRSDGQRDESKQAELDSSVHRKLKSLGHGDFDVMLLGKIGGFGIAGVDVTRDADARIIC